MIRAIELLSIVGIASGCYYLISKYREQRAEKKADDQANNNPFADPLNNHPFADQLNNDIAYSRWQAKDKVLFDRLYETKQVDPDELALISQERENNNKNSKNYDQWLLNEKALFSRLYTVKEDVSDEEFERTYEEIRLNDAKLAAGGYSNFL